MECPVLKEPGKHKRRSVAGIDYRSAQLQSGYPQQYVRGQVNTCRRQPMYSGVQILNTP